MMKVGTSANTEGTAVVELRLDIPACWRRGDWRSGFRRRLLSWFVRNRRDLPWRRTKDPYAVWISEIMLQQTQTPTVVRYFERFLTAFPTLEALAQADQAEVLRLWEGMGYYRRAVHLHETARKIVSEFDGQFPQRPEELRQLPGVGRYTAGAILSIAFDQRQPILEANTVRLWARLLAYSEPVGSASAHRLFWYMAERVLPRRQVGQFNQALMELGSTVCLPRQPGCAKCPVRRFCLAFQKGIQETLPRQQAKPTSQFCQEAALVVRRNDQVLLRRIPDGERWAGLWDFPRFLLPTELAKLAETELARVELAELQAASAHQPWLFPAPAEETSLSLETSSALQTAAKKVGRNTHFKTVPKSRRSRNTPFPLPSSSSLVPAAMAEFLIEQMQRQMGIVVRPLRRLKTIRYAVTRYRVRMECYEAEYLGLADRRKDTAGMSKQKTGGLEPWGSRSGEEAKLGRGVQWVRRGALESYPMSSPARKLAQFVQTGSTDSGKGKGS